MIEQDFVKNNYTYLGLMNDWETVIINDINEFKQVEKLKPYFDCIKQNHNIKRIKSLFIGDDDIEYCSVCKVYWKVNSSD